MELRTGLPKPNQVRVDDCVIHGRTAINRTINAGDLIPPIAVIRPNIVAVLRCYVWAVDMQAWLSN